jgi:hypothetical protein
MSGIPIEALTGSIALQTSCWMREDDVMMMLSLVKVLFRSVQVFALGEASGSNHRKATTGYLLNNAKA